MKETVRKHFEGNTIISYNETNQLTWKEAKKSCPSLPKGWFELSKLDGNIRLEFIRDYWINALPYLPHIYAFFDRFFAKVEEIGIVSAKDRPYMYYALDSGCFIGGAPLLDDEIDLFKEQINFSLPADFLQFFRIHNSFKKGSDTGIFPFESLIDEVEKVQSIGKNIYCASEVIDPQSLFPFYRSFNLDVYQCFYRNWYVDGEMGNVLCSLKEGTVSNFRTRDKGREYLAFPTFLDWLTFYLEDEI